MSDVNEINDLIHAKVRLGIMSLLMTYEECDFSLLKKSLAITDGNLGSHLKKLEDANYVTINKKFVSNKPKTIIKISKTGADAYKEYIKIIESIINSD
ncbi:ArsR family transcriptional regulator [Salibacterium salarium]|uniref:ArsR family transcriptional regulator n=1 Tax=Salibacterium salarium TaxID=284579 RepID=A0A3R9WN09_9BACI|nr:transcriptional regulator [Salibacterium salarium]RSL29931.1 ArsR family transcriptional regulator [Salibacterium salarium]